MINIYKPSRPIYDMAIKIFRNFFKRILQKIFRNKKDIKLGFYGPPNAGKTSLANRICKDFTGEEIGSVSKVPHETRTIQFKERVEIEYKGKSMTFKMIDTPGIATKIDYEEFLKYKVKKSEAKKRAKEATQGIIESIKWLEDMDIVVVVLDATENPYNQVNITIIGNLIARKIPVLIVANKIDLRKSNLKKIETAFPEYDVIGISAKYGKNLEEFYESIFKLSKKVR
jgi:small GTP-binding protein